MQVQSQVVGHHFDTGGNGALGELQFIHIVLGQGHLALQVQQPVIGEDPAAFADVL